MKRFEPMHRLNPPPRHTLSDGALEIEALEIETGPEADVWQATCRGFTPDSGHALLAPVSGDVVAERNVAGNTAHSTTGPG